MFFLNPKFLLKMEISYLCDLQVNVLGFSFENWIYGHDLITKNGNSNNLTICTFNLCARKTYFIKFPLMPNSILSLSVIPKSPLIERPSLTLSWTLNYDNDIMLKAKPDACCPITTAESGGFWRPPPSSSLLCSRWTSCCRFICVPGHLLYNSPRTCFLFGGQAFLEVYW